MIDEQIVYTFGMDEGELGRRLDETQNAVLSLADEGRAYAVPISYHAADDVWYLRLSVEPDSHKLAFVEATEEATVLVYGAEGPESSWSIVARGPVELLDRDDWPFPESEFDAHFPPLRIFDETVEDVTVALAAFTPEEITGRKTGSQTMDRAEETAEE